MHLSEIVIYAVFEDRELDGFSFDAEPGTAEKHRVHAPLSRVDPGGDLRLVGFRTRAEALACAYGLECCPSGELGWLVQTFADDLTCVLIDFVDSDESALLLDDRRGDDRAGAQDGSA